MDITVQVRIRLAHIHTPTSIKIKTLTRDGFGAHAAETSNNLADVQYGVYIKSLQVVF